MYLSQIVAAHGIGEQAIVSDTVEAGREDMDEEAADELVGVQGHGFVLVLLFLTIVFPFKRDAPFIVGDQAVIGDGDAVCVSGEVGQHGFGSCEGSFGIDHPLDVSHGLQVVIEGLWIGQHLVSSKELQLPCAVRINEILQEQTPEQPGQDAHRQKEPWSACYPTLSFI